MAIVDHSNHDVARHQCSHRDRGGWLFELRRNGGSADGVDCFGQVGVFV